jgi:hypothetical protein
MSALRGSYSNFLKNGGGTDMSLKQAIDVLPTAMDKPVFKDLVKQLKNQVSIRRDIFQPSNYIQRNIGMDNPYADSVLGSGAGLPAAKPEPTFDLVADPTAPGGYRMVPHVPKIGGGIQ